jgi:hypothetical protein
MDIMQKNDVKPSEDFPAQPASEPMSPPGDGGITEEVIDRIISQGI